MSGILSWGFLHQQHLKLGEMKPAQKIVYSSRQKRAFLSLLLLARAICIKSILFPIIAGLCAGPQISVAVHSCSPQSAVANNKHLLPCMTSPRKAWRGVISQTSGPCFYIINWFATWNVVIKLSCVKQEHMPLSNECEWGKAAFHVNFTMINFLPLVRGDHKHKTLVVTTACKQTWQVSRCSYVLRRALTTLRMLEVGLRSAQHG